MACVGAFRLISLAVSPLRLIHGTPSSPTISDHPAWRCPSFQPVPLCPRPATVAHQPLGRSSPPDTHTLYPSLAIQRQFIPLR